MGRRWVLETDTKGTGARIVPLERAPERSAPEDREVFVPPERRPRPATEPPPKEPARFKVVDVRSQEVLAEDAGMRATLDALERVDSVVDVLVYRWSDESQRWRLLDMEDQRKLWSFRGRLTRRDRG